MDLHSGETIINYIYIIQTTSALIKAGTTEITVILCTNDVKSGHERKIRKIF